MIHDEEYPPNHVTDDGTVVRYRFERDLSAEDRQQEMVDAAENVLAMLHVEAQSSEGLREVTLHSRHTIAWVCGWLTGANIIVHRDGKWRVAS